MGLFESLKNWFGNRYKSIAHYFGKDVVVLDTEKFAKSTSESVAEFHNEMKQTYLDMQKEYEKQITEAKTIEIRPKHEKFDQIVKAIQQEYEMKVDDAYAYANEIYKTPVPKLSWKDIEIIKEWYPDA